MDTLCRTFAACSMLKGCLLDAEGMLARGMLLAGIAV